MNDFEDDLGVDLTPLIDVIFMLIIFFLMTMSFSLPIVDFSLPGSNTASYERQEHKLTLSADRTGQLYLNGSAISLKEAAQRLKEHPECVLELVPDRNAPAQVIIDAADLARRYASGRLVIAAERKEKTDLLVEEDMTKGTTGAEEQK